MPPDTDHCCLLCLLLICLAIDLPYRKCHEQNHRNAHLQKRHHAITILPYRRSQGIAHDIRADDRTHAPETGSQLICLELYAMRHNCSVRIYGSCPQSVWNPPRHSIQKADAVEKPYSAIAVKRTLHTVTIFTPSFFVNLSDIRLEHIVPNETTLSLPPHKTMVPEAPGGSRARLSLIRSLAAPD